MCREAVGPQARVRSGSPKSVPLWMPVVGILALVTTACTGAHSAPTHGSSRATSASPVASSLPPASSPPGSPSPSPSVGSPPTAVSTALSGTLVLSAATPSRMSLSVSQALFTSAATVVVAAAADPAGIAEGAQDAERLGVPMLLVDRDVGLPRSAIPTAELLARELTRLGTTTAVALGSSAAAVHAADPTIRVVSDASQLPVSATSTDTTLTVLVRAGGDPKSVAGAAAATACAHVAGANVVAVQGGDPRRDPAATAELMRDPRPNMLAVGAEFGSPTQLKSRLAVAGKGTQLPGGGQIFFPGRRLVALYGHPGGAALGVLGAQDVAAGIVRVKQLAAAYAPMSKVPVVPAFEIIATVAQASAGSDGNFSNESSVASLLPWVQQANAAGLYVVLDLQPGTADALEQAKRYVSLLQLPNVGLAIDPEWALALGQQPLAQIGSIDSSRINAVGAWLEQLTASKHLPQKLFVIHQFRLTMIGHESALNTRYDDVAVLIHMDG